MCSCSRQQSLPVLRLRPHPAFLFFSYTTLFRSPNVVYAAAFDQGLWRRDAGASATSFQQVFRPQFNQGAGVDRSEEHTSELQSLRHLVCRLLLEKKKYGRELTYSCLHRIANRRL